MFLVWPAIWSPKGSVRSSAGCAVSGGAPSRWSSLFPGGSQLDEQLVARQLLLAQLVQAVTAIANDYGFAELGRFSVAYRKLFNEPRSQTLRLEVDQREGISAPWPHPF